MEFPRINSYLFSWFIVEGSWIKNEKVLKNKRNSLKFKDTVNFFIEITFENGVSLLSIGDPSSHVRSTAESNPPCIIIQMSRRLFYLFLMFACFPIL